MNFVHFCPKFEKIVNKKIMNKRWVVNATPDEKKVSELSSRLNCNPVVANLLIQRGIESYEEALDFFNPKLEQLHNPFLMKDMEQAVERLDRAIQKGERILVFGDYDVDGCSAVAVLCKYLHRFCQRGLVDYYVPDRYDEGYGVSKKGIDYAADTGVSLLIITDCGIKDVDKVEYAKSKGIDIIICDHHTPGDEIPAAVAVLDPQREDCNYPYKWLSGCGVAFKLVQAYGIKKGRPQSEVYELLDLLCVSIASDIVPITGENRILAYYGLKQLNTNPSLGLKTIIDTLKIDKSISINDIVFKIGPRINAAGRVESGQRAVDLLVAENREKAENIARTINSYNDERKKLDHNITEEAINKIKSEVAAESKKTTVLYNPQWHKGVVGIVASRLTESFYRPTIILTNSNGYATGSARSVEGFDLYNAISQCSEFLENYGGHKYAAGLTMKPENIEKFKEKFERIVAETIDEEMLRPQINIDAKLHLEDITPDFYEMLEKFAPFGPNNTIPVFETDEVQDYFGKSQIVGKNIEHQHLKLTVVGNIETRSGANNERSGIAFGMGRLYSKISKGKQFDICYSLQENRFMGRSDIQMIIRDIRFPEEEQ